jgi:hypothetical protein
MTTFWNGFKVFMTELGNTLIILAKSRKAVLALVGSLLTFVVAVSPSLAPYQDKVVNVVDLFIGVVIAGIALEDAAVKFRSGGDRGG